MSGEATIGAVPLYQHLDRIDKCLANAGIGSLDSIPLELLFSLDQWHYHGIDAVREAAKKLELTQRSEVLEIGSGVGGPARCLAHVTGCRVTALELQAEIHDIGSNLTRRVGLDDRVVHLCGDALSYPLRSDFDAVVSWLALLHIDDRSRLLSRLKSSLRPGGILYVEDLFMRAPFSPTDARDLRDLVFGVSVTTLEDYSFDLEQAGFASAELDDTTEDWAGFAAERLQAWRRDRVHHVAAQGEDAYAAQENFYAVIARLFDSGSLGGVRVLAR